LKKKKKKGLFINYIGFNYILEQLLLIFRIINKCKVQEKRV